MHRFAHEARHLRVFQDLIPDGGCVEEAGDIQLAVVS